MTNAFSSNLLYGSGFRVVIDRFPDIKYLVSSIQLPTVSAGSSVYPVPGTTISMLGDKVNYGELTLTFKLTEDLKIWKEFVKWIMAVESAERYQENGEKNLRSDISVILLDASSNPVMTVNIIEAFPTTISFPELGADDESPQDITVVFELAYFDIV